MEREKSSIAKIKIEFPEEIWISEIFEEFPDIKMEILYFLPFNLEEYIGNALIEIKHYDIESIVEIVRDHPSVMDFNIVERNENKIRFNVKTKDPYLLHGAIKCGVLVDFPVKVEEGYAYWDLISSRESIDELLSLFEELDLNFELLRIGTSDLNLEDPQYKLSLDELKILEEAINRGFFDVPRKISLEELGNILNKSKSTLSVQLRKIIKKKVLINT
jgi:predicted DNA binding protein